MNIQNATNKTKAITFTNMTFNDTLHILGNHIIVLKKCKFLNGLRISGLKDFSPVKVFIDDCESIPKDSFYPIKISNTLNPNVYIKEIYLNNVIAQGNGQSYELYSLINGGTPDNFGIHHANYIELNNCYSANSGENGYSINFCKSLTMNNCSAVDNDGQGLHIGRHNNDISMSINLAIIENFKSVNNWRNQLGVNGTSCGILIHDVEKVYVNNLLSIDNELAASYILREGEGFLEISGDAYGASEQLIRNTKNVSVKSKVERL